MNAVRGTEGHDGLGGPCGIAFNDCIHRFEDDISDAKVLELVVQDRESPPSANLLH